ncbi:hypothetical protein RO3G_06569 [Rhizopus delemar RA 99-880]|uniref:Uncharacterized protein n=1 Tax=Rhizopus delemar (strain RA 99-880 / ATCC MYA-4621 / FGSC 9543 / NRRL 43880) TaxID=246409 RepID=I1C084_RHIO9|nr:hypothetical protein RO3G_06569 [Rhizopus delemar RA 99-880]|eukprot:EIE81864.1 hypothetical protein RO3G_06569 [Rhizopus delemar RA 99-880]
MTTEIFLVNGIETEVLLSEVSSAYFEIGKGKASFDYWAIRHWTILTPTPGLYLMDKEQKNTLGFFHGNYEYTNDFESGTQKCLDGNPLSTPIRPKYLYLIIPSR